MDIYRKFTEDIQTANKHEKCSVSRQLEEMQIKENRHPHISWQILMLVNAIQDKKNNVYSYVTSGRSINCYYVLGE